MSKRVKEVLGRHLLVQQLSQGKASMIALPDSTVQRSFLAVIKKVGKDVRDKNTLKENVICLINPASRQKATRLNEWFVEESEIYLIKRGSHYSPFGYRILISRLNNVDVKVGSLYIPQCNHSSDQTLFGTVYSKGIVNGFHIQDLGFEIGDIVKIKDWNIKIREVEIDGCAYLSVPLSLVEYACDTETFQNNFAK